MSTLTLPFLVVGGLVIAAVSAPRLLRAAAPVLTRIPRIAVALLIGGLLTWLLTIAAVGLMAAWTLSGPRVLPASLADVCQRCLEASSPFAGMSTTTTAIPVVLLLLLPPLGLIAVMVLQIPRLLRGRRRTRALSAELALTGRSERLLGYQVLLIDDPRPVAFSLPRRHGGIVVSDGLCAILETDELCAVLEHERAHLQQNHHLIMAWLGALTRPMRWVPLVSAIAAAIPHYLEIAADNRARGRFGTPALARALLKIGQPQTMAASPDHDRVTSPILHVAGPHRIGHLVAPDHSRGAALPALALLLQFSGLAAVAAVTHGPYIRALLAGCQVTT